MMNKPAQRVGALLLVLSAGLTACTTGVESTSDTPPPESPTQTTEDRKFLAEMTEPKTPSPDLTDPAVPTTEVATLGAGCFWCIEAILQQVDGIESVVSGYMGGHVENPTYKAVCDEVTGHAEVVQVTFDPAVISYAEVLDWFWRLHDPTTLNRQGNDKGTQYRSAIFTHSESQLQIAQTSAKDVQPTFADPIVTEITPASAFYKAEGYHQGYYFENQGQRYCRGVIQPKLKKLGLKY